MGCKDLNPDKTTQQGGNPDLEDHGKFTMLYFFRLRTFRADSVM